MITVGFVSSPGEPGDIYRGMDAYARYLFRHLEPLQSDAFRLVSVPADKPGSRACDLLHFPVFSLYRRAIPLSLSIPYVVTVHDVTRLEFATHYPPGVRGRFRLWQQRLILARSKLVITDSYSSVSQIRRYLGLPSAKIRLVPLAADPIFRPLKPGTAAKKIQTAYRLPNRYILTNGDIDWNKNLLGLASACNRLNLPLVVYGKSPKDFLDYPGRYNSAHPELAHLPRLRQELTNPNIRLTGFVPEADLVMLFNLAAAYCQPSFAEGFGIPVLQALACGTPVACSRTHSLPEIAADAALYFEPADPASLDSALSRLMSDPDLRRLLKSAGPARAARFSWNQTAAATLTVYNEACRPKS